MNTRDNVIDEKINALKAKKANIENELNELPKFITNLTLKHNGTTTNLRCCVTISDVYKAYKIVNEEHMLIQNFNKVLESANVPEFTTLVYGYSIEDWMSDIVVLIKKIHLNETLTKVNKALADIEKFYSGDRKEENAFNALLGDIDNI